MITKDHTDKGVSPLAVGMAGVVIGSTMGAAAVAFSDKRNRDKAVKKITALKGDLDKWSDTLVSKSRKLSGKAPEKFHEKVEEAAVKAESMTEDVSGAASIE